MKESGRNYILASFRPPKEYFEEGNEQSVGEDDSPDPRALMIPNKGQQQYFSSNSGQTPKS